MPKMPKPRHHHRHVRCIAEVDGQRIVLRAAGLNDCRDAFLVGDFDAVGEREKRIGGHDRAIKVETKGFCFVDGLTERIHARRLSAAHANELAFFDQSDGVGFEVLDALGGEEHFAHLLGRRDAFGDGLQVCFGLGFDVRVLFHYAIQKASERTRAHLKVFDAE